MGRNGGFPFLIAYLFFIVILGLPVMMTEMSLGRKTRHDPVQAYADIDPHAKIVGIFGVMAAFVILSYYSVIGGGVLKNIFSFWQMDYKIYYQLWHDFSGSGRFYHVYQQQ